MDPLRFLVVAPRYAKRRAEFYAFPIGLAYLSSALKTHGYDVACLNLNHREGTMAAILADAIRKEAIDVVLTGGLSVHYNRVKEIVDAARAARPDIRIVVGGGLVSSEPELVTNALGADAGCIGEGEETVVDIARAFAAGGDLSAVRGIVYRGPDGTLAHTASRPPIDSLDTVAFPDMEGLQIGAYLDIQRTNDDYSLNPFDAPRMVPIISSRSCPYNCTFCFHPLGTRYRRRSLDNLFEEIDLLARTYRINYLAIYDELFSNDAKRLEEFCDRIRPYGLQWLAQMRVDAVDAPMLRELKASGLHCISYGLESASDAVLKSMKKHITAAQIENALALTREAGIGIQGNFIFGDPAETLETARTTLEWWRNHGSYHITFSPIHPYPGSEDYRYCVKQGLIGDRLEYIRRECPAVNMTSMSDAALKDIFSRAEEVFLENLAFAEIVALEREGPDPLRGVDTFTLTARCPHCGADSTYRRYIPEPAGAKLLTLIPRLHCRACNQRYDLSPEAMAAKCSDPNAARTLRRRAALVWRRHHRIYHRLGKGRKSLSAWWRYIRLSRKYWLLPAVLPLSLSWIGKARRLERSFAGK